MSTCAKEPKPHHPDFSKFSTTERFEHAKRITSRVVDHLHYLIALHENNAIVLYSPTLSSQIPRSYAANAFRVFQTAMHQFEIVRLVALWDHPDIETESILTIRNLIDCTDVINQIKDEAKSHWAHDFNSIEFGNKQARAAETELTAVLGEISKISSSSELKSIRNLRNKHLAHSVRESRLEKSLGPISPMRYGQERHLLNMTIPIVRTLYLWINSIDYDIENTREIARKRARELWDSCKFSGIKDFT